MHQKRFKLFQKQHVVILLTKIIINLIKLYLFSIIMKNTMNPEKKCLEIINRKSIFIEFL